MKPSHAAVVGACVLACVTGVFAEMIRVGLPGWRVDGNHTITRVEIDRMDIAHFDPQILTRSITNRAAVLEFAKQFALFIASDEVRIQDTLSNPLFQIRVAHGQKNTRLYLTVERGITQQQNKKAGTPSAAVTLWQDLPDGKYQEYCSRNYVPVQTNHYPEPLLRIYSLFKEEG